MDAAVVHAQLAVRQHAIHTHAALVTNAIHNPVQVQAINVITQMGEAMRGHPVRFQLRQPVQTAMTMTVMD